MCSESICTEKLLQLVDELLPQLEQDGVATGVFYTPGARDVMPTPGLLRRDLLDEQRGASNPSSDQEGQA